MASFTIAASAPAVAKSACRPAQASAASSRPVPASFNRQFNGSVALPALRARAAVSGEARRRTGMTVGRATTVVAVAGENWIPVATTDSLPKGERQQVSAGGKEMMIFWYRNEIFAIEFRAPTEGAYSEGFMDSKFTQDGCIECPQTGTAFDIKTGEIKNWYPNNAVLRTLTPQDTCRPMETFPVMVEDGKTIMVDPSNSNLVKAGIVIKNVNTKGGSTTSLERNNVFGLEPKVYLEGNSVEDGLLDTDDSIKIATKMSPATLAIGTVAVGIVAVAGTAACLYYENIPRRKAALAALKAEEAGERSSSAGGGSEEGKASTDEVAPGGKKKGGKGARGRT